MANKTLFRSIVGTLLPRANAVNAEGAPAYRRTPEQSLAQLTMTGCLNSTFYASANDQLENALNLAAKVSPDFLARAAVYGRERGHMKDLPALLVAMLSRRDTRLMERVFDRVIDTPRMLRTFVQIVRSGRTGRKSLGTAPQRCIRRWLGTREDAALFTASVGRTPSLVDVLKLVHPKPFDRRREALYGYLMGRPVSLDLLPDVVREFEAFKADRSMPVPDVPFEMLTALALDRRAWIEIARRGSWQTTRMNLNTFARHGVFEDPSATDAVAAKLRDASLVARARALPYQLMAAARAATGAVPQAVLTALEDAMELAIANVPEIAGRVFICPDVSGSMQSPITGGRKGATTAVRCVDVAALMTSALLRKNPASTVLPFDWNVHSNRMSPRDTVFTNAERLAAIGGGGTCISAPLEGLNRGKALGDLMIIISDNESWVDAAGPETATMRQWQIFKARNPQARLVLLDLQPSMTTQVIDREDVLNIGGFSDAVFEVIAEFAAGGMGDDRWVQAINRVEI